MFGSRLNILTNGTPILGGCGNRMDAPSSYISPELYDRVTITKGPQTVLWGGGASAATIRFDRMSPDYAEPSAEFQAGFLAGSNNHYDQFMDATAGTDLAYVRLNANHARSGDYEDGNGQTVPSKWKKWNTDATIGLTPDKNTLLELSLGKSDGYARYAGRDMDGSEFRKDSIGFRFKKSGFGRLLEKMEFQTFYHYVDHVMDNYTLRPVPATGRMKSNPMRTLYGGRAAATFSINETTSLIAGADYLYDEHESRTSMMPVKTKNIRTTTAGLFGELHTGISDRDEIIAGLRGNFITSKDFRTQGVADKYDNTRNEFLPSVFVRHEHSFQDKPLMSYIGLGYTERFPDFWEIRQKSHKNGKNAFSSLNPEKTLQLDTGFQYKTAKARLWSSAYAGVISDYILFDYTSGSTTVKNVEAKIAGAEIGAAYTIFNSLHLNSSLAYSWGENTSNNKPLPQMSPLEIRLGADYTTRQWQAGFLWRLVAKQTRTSVNQGNVVGKDFDNSTGFGVLSLYSGIRIMDGAELRFGIDNVFDHAYYEHLNKDGASGWGFAANERIYEPGRTFWSRFMMNF
jgi:iron complex outermembrane receptor protein